MEYVKTSLLSKAELSHYLNLLARGIRRDSLSLEGHTIDLPNTQYQCNVKYSDDSGSHLLVAELTWDKVPESLTGPRGMGRLSQLPLRSKRRGLLRFLAARCPRRGE